MSIFDQYSDIEKFGLGAGLGGLGAGFGALFGGGGDDPYKKGAGYLNQIPGKTSPYYQPYAQAGQGALGQLQGQYGNLLGNYGGIQGQYNQLMNDPNGVMNKIGAGYQKSPGFDWQMNQGMNAANNAAASGGMAGSPQHQQQAATMAEGLANQDYYNYMNKALGLYGTGLQGNQGLYNQGLAGTQGLNQMGFNANDQMARIMADSLSQQGQMAFAGQAAQNQSQGQGWGNMIGGAMQILPFLL